MFLIIFSLKQPQIQAFTNLTSNQSVNNFLGRIQIPYWGIPRKQGRNLASSCDFNEDPERVSIYKCLQAESVWNVKLASACFNRFQPRTLQHCNLTLAGKFQCWHFVVENISQISWFTSREFQRLLFLMNLIQTTSFMSESALKWSRDCKCHEWK